MIDHLNADRNMTRHRFYEKCCPFGLSPDEGCASRALAERVLAVLVEGSIANVHFASARPRARSMKRGALGKLLAVVAGLQRSRRKFTQLLCVLFPIRTGVCRTGVSTPNMRHRPRYLEGRRYSAASDADAVGLPSEIEDDGCQHSNCVSTDSTA